MSGSQEEIFCLEVTFKKSGLVCSGYCSGNHTDDAERVEEEVYTKTYDVSRRYIEDYIYSDDDTLVKSELKKYTTDMCECSGSQYCSDGIKVKREAISGKLVKKKKTLKQQYLEMCQKRGKN